VSWNPSGTEICYLSHDATLNFVKINLEDYTRKEKPEKVNFHTLPHTKGIYVDDNTYVAGGFDKVPFLFK